MSYNIEILNKLDAKAMLKWTYPSPYSFYNMEDSKECLSELLDGTYYLVKEDESVIGFFCFGNNAQIPIKEAKGLYEENLLDIGLGMNPLFVDKGEGKKFLNEGLNFAINTLHKSSFRLTVAKFNERAIKVYKKFGFETVNSFVREKDNIEFYIMTLSKKKTVAHP
ncbi:MAG: GNAT family N-acetyltransferase [Spirochaetaceae bacterium]